jgi:hypothetical protein
LGVVLNAVDASAPEYYYSYRYYPYYGKEEKESDRSIDEDASDSEQPRAVGL